MFPTSKTHFIPKQKNEAIEKVSKIVVPVDLSLWVQMDVAKYLQYRVDSYITVIIWKVKRRRYLHSDDGVDEEE